MICGLLTDTERQPFCRGAYVNVFDLDSKVKGKTHSKTVRERTSDNSRNLRKKRGQKMIVIKRKCFSDSM